MNSRAEGARQRLRAAHGVRLVRADEEGTSALALSPGVYGFTGSPGLAAPLFAQRRYRNFEIHHLADGGVAIVGFVSARNAARLASAGETIDATIYPDLEADATEIVAIRYAQIAQHRQYSVRNAAGMNLRVSQVPYVAGQAPANDQSARTTS